MLLVCEKKIKFQSTEMKRIACQVWLTILLLKLKKTKQCYYQSLYCGDQSLQETKQGIKRD